MAKIPWEYLQGICKIGIPTAIQGMAYCAISMVLTRMISGYGAEAVATQRVGGQIESISWNTADGFAAALNAFIAQNYGAGKNDRVKKGYKASLWTVGIWGLLISAVFICMPEPIARIFFHEPKAIATSVEYLIIIGFSEAFMCVELTTVGALSGLGRMDAVEQVNVIYSNAAALVIPLVRALLGDEYVIYSCAFIIVQLILLWTHASSLLQGDRALDWKKVFSNINMIAIAAGALLYWFRVALPAPLQNTMSTMGDMIGPMGMLLAGMAIAEKPLRDVFCTRRNYLPTVLRLVVCPLVVLVLLLVCHASSWVADGKNILMTVYLAAITPACATVTSMAQLYDRDAAHSSALYVLTTLLSIITMPVMIGLFDLLL